MIVKNCLVCIFFIVWLIGCTEAPEPDQGKQPPVQNTEDTLSPLKVWVSNEGNFGFGNASLSLLIPDSNQTFHTIFETSNDSRLGDVFQSMSFQGDTLWMLVNNSGKVVGMNTNTFQTVGEITGFNSPRYLHVFQDSLAIVTELYAEQIYIVNLNHRTIVQTLSSRAYTERMVQIQDHLYIGSAFKNTNAIERLNLQTFTFEEDLVPEDTPSFLVAYERGMIYDQDSSLVYLDSNLVERQLQLGFPLSDFAVLDWEEGAFVTTKPEGGDWELRLAWQDGSYSILQVLDFTPYGKMNAIQRKNGSQEIYLQNAKDFVSRGELLRIVVHGSNVERFAYEVRSIPNDVAFQH